RRGVTVDPVVRSVNPVTAIGIPIEANTDPKTIVRPVTVRVGPVGTVIAPVIVAAVVIPAMIGTGVASALGLGCRAAEKPCHRHQRGGSAKPPEPSQHDHPPRELLDLTNLPGSAHSRTIPRPDQAQKIVFHAWRSDVLGLRENSSPFRCRVG